MPCPGIDLRESRRTRIAFRLFGAALGACLLLAATSVVAHAAEPLDPLTLTKYVDPLPIPVPMASVRPNVYEIGAWPIAQKLHRDLPPTNLYGYGPTQATATYPGMTIEAKRGTATRVHWTNHLPLPHLLDYAIDPTIGRAITTTGVPMTPHVHGGEQAPRFDGGPMTWFTPGFAERGPDWQQETYVYDNHQQAATIWYHDHAYGYTRHNVYAGLAGFYLLRDPDNEPENLPKGKYEVPIVIQDRMLFDDGQLNYPVGGDNPEIHPIWQPEFFGDLIVVNGKIWPYLEVERHRYRFRFLNGSQARFYSLALVNRATNTPGPAFTQIGTDGGLLASPVVVNDPANAASPRLLMAPGERCDVVIDFGKLPAGTELLLTNTANGPYPDGDPVDPQTTGQIMLFKVLSTRTTDKTVVPAMLNRNAPRLSNPLVTRQMTLNEVQGPNGPAGMFLNGMEMMAPATEIAQLGTTEEWDVVNLTMDTHPIHLHLVQYQILERQAFDVDGYMAAYDAANPVLPTMDPVTVPVAPYLMGAPMAPDANETGWKDTFRMNPGEVTRVLVRFAPQDKTFGRSFPFDATASPGYVWHCHILEHEENDMMRPLLVTKASPAVAAMLAAQTAAEDAAELGSPGVETAQAIPAATELRAASTNPTHAGSVLRFALPSATPVDLRIYDVQGKLVGVLATGTYAAGEHQVQWSGADESGRPLASGVYFARLQAGPVTRSQKLMLVH